MEPTDVAALWAQIQPVAIAMLAILGAATAFLGRLAWVISKPAKEYAAKEEAAKRRLAEYEEQANAMRQELLDAITERNDQLDASMADMRDQLDAQTAIATEQTRIAEETRQEVAELTAEVESLKTMYLANGCELAASGCPNRVPTTRVPARKQRAASAAKR